MLHQGQWDHKTFVNRSLAQKMTTYAGMPIQPRTPGDPGPASGLCWRLNYDGV
jgi:hypothetical protein